ncbi:MAG: hypothetical protein ACPG8A_06665 [Psychrobium sp.]
MNTFRLLLFSGLTIVLLGCHNDEERKEKLSCEASSTCPAPIVKLAGTAATGVGIDEGTIEVFDGSGNKFDATATTNESGNFVVEFNGEIPVPIQLVITDNEGNKLTTVITDSETTVANINPITDYVAQSLLADNALDQLSNDDIDNAGQTVVESLLGEGADYDAFATQEFVAKTSASDFATTASAADVLLDSIAEAAVGQDIASLIEETVNSESTLLSSPEFVVSVASNIAMINGDDVNLADVFNANETPSEVTDQLADVNVFQQTAEAVIEQVSQTQGLNDEQKAATSAGILDIIESAAVKQEALSQSEIESISDNVVENLLEDVVRTVQSPEAQQLSADELLAAVSNTAEQIVDTIDEKGVDLSDDNVDLSTVKAEVASVKIVIENTTDWGNAKWDKLVWQ